MFFSKIKAKYDIPKILTALTAWSIILIFIIIVVFVIVSAIPAYKQFSFADIFLSNSFNLSADIHQASIWFPLSITILVTFGALLIAAPIGIKTATFIKFRLPKRLIKKAFILTQALSGIPSVIFGIFALKTLGLLTTRIFHLDSPYTIINAIIMLSFMILPTIISLTLATYNSISDSLFFSPIGLGLNKTSAIYKIFKKKAKNGIIVAIIIATGRAIGETMALSMILPSDSYENVFNGGFFEILRSSVATLSSIIATNMFSENGGPALRGVLYVFGIFLFIFILLLNSILLFINRSKNLNNSRYSKMVNKIGNFVLLVPNQIGMFFQNKMYSKKKNINQNFDMNVNDFIEHRIKTNKSIFARSYWLMFWEAFCATITFAFLMWIVLDILIGAGIVFNQEQEFVSIFDFSKNSTGQALVNTLILIIVALLVSFPIAIFSAIYLNEYCKELKAKKTITFFIDSLGACPSIIFGIFGLSLFIEILGISSGGTIGKSLLAGALTISIVILPALIRTIELGIKAIPMTVRENAYALGCSKWQTIWKIVLPQSFNHLIIAGVLVTGRIMAETAPLYLTAGLTSASQISLMNPGQTLTTRIYAQLASNDILSSNVIEYECAFLSLGIILFLIYLGYVLIPNYRWYLFRLNKYLKNLSKKFMAKSKNKNTLKTQI